MGYQNNIAQFPSAQVSAHNRNAGPGPSSAVASGAACLGETRPAERGCVGSALSWFVTHVMKDYTNYTEAMNAALSARVADRVVPFPSMRIQHPKPPTRSRYREPYGRRNPPRPTIVSEWSGRLASGIIASWSRAQRERVIRTAIADLESLDDWTLRDIGVPRCMIELIVRSESVIDAYSGVAGQPPATLHRLAPALPVRLAPPSAAEVGADALATADV